MAKVTERKGIERSSLEVRTYEGKNTRRHYLVFKGHVGRSDFFLAFAPVELKEAMLDIDGVPDTKQQRKDANSSKLAAKVWYRPKVTAKRGMQTAAGSLRK